MLNLFKKKLSQVVSTDVQPSLTKFQEISHWRLIYDSENPPMGTGSYSNVYRGEWEEREVAIKKFKTEREKNDVQEVAANEVSILTSIGHHPNLVYCYGQATADDLLHLVFEYMSGGTLTRHLSFNNLNPSQYPIRKNMALQIAQALVYLWSLKIIHRDIKSDNILLDANNNAKIADFGICIKLSDDEDFYSTFHPNGTFGWVPPEVFPKDDSSPGICTETHDIWSYGVLLWMLASNRIYEPFQGMPANQIETYTLEGTPQSLITRTITKECKTLLTRCWDKDPKKRPKASEIVGLLEGGLKLSTQVKS